MLRSSARPTDGEVAVDWLLLAVLGIIWATFLLPSRRGSGDRTSENLELLTHMQNEPTPPGRWVLMPRQDVRFIGLPGRVQSRVRQRRRQVLSVLGEAIAFSGLIGAFPPLRAMWVVTAVLIALLVVYVGMLLRLRLRTGRRAQPVILPTEDIAVVRRPTASAPPSADRRVATS